MATEKKESSKRRGKAAKTGRGKAAEFEAGSASAPKGFDAASVAEELDMWWEDGGGANYYVGNGCGTMWSCWPEKKVQNLFRSKYVRLKSREGETLSEADRVLMHTMQERRLDVTLGAIAGYRSGVYDISGRRVLVRSSPQLVTPKEGDWDTVSALIHAKLDPSYSDPLDGGVDQTDYFHGWMKTSLEGLYLGGPGNFRPGQCVIFAGRADSGKSRLQHQIVTGLLGRRSADPGPYLFGRTDFNGEMFAAEHLMMEDPASSQKTADRVYFGEMLKQLVVNDTQRLHEKRENAIIVSPFFRTTISINDDPDKLRVLPLLTPDIQDKVMLFLVNPAPLPMPTSSAEERLTFRQKIEEELPAYAWWLLNVFQIPDHMKSRRFGVREWQHPALLSELFDDTPQAELLRIIDAVKFVMEPDDLALWGLESASKSPGETWEGTAFDLEKLLLGESCPMAREAKRLFLHNKIDRLLSRLKEDSPDRVAHRRTKLARHWIITRPTK